MIKFVEYEAPNSEKCSKCDQFDPEVWNQWRQCNHPDRYDIAEETEEDRLFNSVNPAESGAPEVFNKLPPNYTDKGCPLERDRMFKTIIGNNKKAEVEFRDQQKYRSLPGLALPAICFLDEYLTKNMRVFEWGSGASTLFFNMRCALTYTVEHSPEWICKIKESLFYRGYGGAVVGGALRLIEPTDGFLSDYASHQSGFDTVNFQKYVREIDPFHDGVFDVILVDGRARCACLKAAQPKLKPGGLLILDDSQRIKYHRTMAEIDWPVIHFEGCIPYYKHGRTVRTTIWVKE